MNPDRRALVRQFARSVAVSVLGERPVALLTMVWLRLWRRRRKR